MFRGKIKMEEAVWRARTREAATITRGIAQGHAPGTVGTGANQRIRDSAGLKKFVETT